MKEFVEKMICRLEEYQENNTLCKSEDDYELGVFNTCEKVIEIVNQLAEEYNNGWIPCSERLPSKEESGIMLQVTIPQYNGNKTVAMKYEYTTIRGKEVSRWIWNDRISPWEVLAWKPMSEPYQKGSDV